MLVSLWISKKGNAETELLREEEKRLHNQFHVATTKVARKHRWAKLKKRKLKWGLSAPSWYRKTMLSVRTGVSTLGMSKYLCRATSVVYWMKSLPISQTNILDLSITTTCCGGTITWQKGYIWNSAKSRAGKRQYVVWAQTVEISGDKNNILGFPNSDLVLLYNRSDLVVVD